MALALAAVFAAIIFSHSPSAQASASSAKEGMVWIPGGSFTMGGVGPNARPDEYPRHEVEISGFWMDETEVTNKQFSDFVRATGYVTTAEKKVDWETLKKDLPADTEKPDEASLAPGSLIFKKPQILEKNMHYSKWWHWQKGACWSHPEGPGSSIAGREDYPVVHVSYFDALEYCKWANKRLPTEAEWEYAARGGLSDKEYCWGDQPLDASRANTWQGSFPVENLKEDGYERTAPAKSFPRNGYGLYHMPGNVWEWCLDNYKNTAYKERLETKSEKTPLKDPSGPKNSLDPRHPFAKELKVQRGGSFLCNPRYCTSYRPSARMSSTPDSSTCHVGFRCVSK